MLPIFSSSALLRKVFLAIFAVIFGGLVGFYFYNETRLREHIHTENAYDQTAARTLEAHSYLLNLRQLEKEFFLTKDIELTVQFQKTLQHTRNLVLEMPEQVGEFERADLIRQIDLYSDTASEMFRLQNRLGVSENLGLEGELRRDIHAVEHALGEVNAYELSVHMLYMRRHEKDFMMRMDPQYLTKFITRYELFNQRLLVSDLSQAQKVNLSNLADNYKAKFMNWSAKKQFLEQHSLLLESHYSKLIRTIDLASHQSILSAQQSARLSQSARTVGRVTLWMLAALAISSTSLLMVLLARYQKFSAITHRLANMDALTKLPNRRQFFSRLDELTEKYANTKGGTFAVGVLDLDGFKPVNDIFGHSFGDQLLQSASRRLKSSLNDNVTLARLGGDEFGLLIEGDVSDDALMSLGNKLCELLRQPFDLEEGTARVAGTIGFAAYPKASQKANSLFERADYALYYAKNNTKGRPAVFSELHAEAIRQRSMIEQAMLRSDLEEEFYLAFQPIIDINNNAVVAMEALARWNSKTLGAVGTEEFIRAAEQLGCVSKLTVILFEKALQAAVDWPKHINLSFNLSARDLSQKEVILHLIAILAKYPIAPNRIIFELTETTWMQDFSRVDDLITELRNLGIQIALDDFGTGYSSLSYIKKMPVDRLKIDRAFIQGVESSKATRDIVSSILHLGQSLELSCIAEGIETMDQLTVMRELGCEMVQGYVFSRPLTSEDALEYIYSHSDPSLIEQPDQDNHPNVVSITSRQGNAR